MNLTTASTPSALQTYSPRAAQLAEYLDRPGAQLAVTVDTPELHPQRHQLTLTALVAGYTCTFRVHVEPGGVDAIFCDIPGVQPPSAGGARHPAAEAEVDVWMRWLCAAIEYTVSFSCHVRTRQTAELRSTLPNLLDAANEAHPRARASRSGSNWAAGSRSTRS